jgi:hypothetical protein
VAATSGQYWTTKAGSTDIPIETKNTPEKMSRSGIASPRMRWAVGRLAHRHACEERPQRHRDAEQRGGPGHAERHRHDEQDEDLAAAGHGGMSEQPRQQPQGGGHQQEQEGRALGHRDQLRAVAAPRREHREDGDQQHRGDVLHRRPGDRQARVAGLQLAALEQDLADHGARGVRDHGAEREALHRTEPEQAPERGGDRDREPHLEQPAADRDPADPQQVAQRELHAHREEQEDDADLGDRGDRPARPDQARREGAEREPGEQEAHDHGLAQPQRERPADERRRERDQQQHEQAARREVALEPGDARHEEVRPARTHAA